VPFSLVLPFYLYGPFSKTVSGKRGTQLRVLAKNDSEMISDNDSISSVFISADFWIENVSPRSKCLNSELLAMPLSSQKSGVPFDLDVRFQPRGGVPLLLYVGGALPIGRGV